MRSMQIISAFVPSLTCIQLFACNSNIEIETVNNLHVIENTDTVKLKVIVGSAVFSATLYNNETVNAFKSKLPMTINMTELNGNEKYYYFSNTLPAKALRADAIQAGDLMLYGNDCLVLFYKSFNTSYSYTKLGCIDDITGLVAAVDSGNVTVRFEL